MCKLVFPHVCVLGGLSDILIRLSLDVGPVWLYVYLFVGQPCISVCLAYVLGINNAQGMFFRYKEFLNLVVLDESTYGVSCKMKCNYILCINFLKG